MMFKPKLIPTTISLIFFILALYLGIWQVERLFWKNNLLKDIQSQQGLKPIELTHSIEIGELNNYVYRNVKVKGEFLNEKEIYLYAGARAIRGVPGYMVLTPFHTNSDEYILVNRGWVPEDQKHPVNRPNSQIEGQVEIEGTILPEEKKTNFTPQNDIEKNVWYSVDLTEASQATAVKLRPYFIVLNTTNDTSTLPIATGVHTKIINNHLGYALTWFAMAFAILIIYIIYHKKNHVKN